MTGPLRCAIIEDEPLAQELLEKYIRRVSSLALIATFDDAIAAFEQLPALHPDVIFLDINMPEMTGIELLRVYPAPHPAIVITTANPNHALDGFDLGVTDYLLKPITFDRFLKSIGRVREKIEKQPTGENTVAEVLLTPAMDTTGAKSSPPFTDFIYLKTDRKLEQIRFDELVFVEALGDYVKVFLTDRYVVTHLTMTKLAESLPSDRFVRINRSYVVQLRYIKTLDGNSVVTSTGHDLMIGPNYRDAVKERIRQWLIT